MEIQPAEDLQIGRRGQMPQAPEQRPYERSGVLVYVSDDRSNGCALDAALDAYDVSTGARPLAPWMLQG